MNVHTHVWPQTNTKRPQLCVREQSNLRVRELNVSQSFLGTAPTHRNYEGGGPLKGRAVHAGEQTDADTSGLLKETERHGEWQPRDRGRHWR